jgi:hypothetical protein
MRVFSLASSAAVIVLGASFANGEGASFSAKVGINFAQVETVVGSVNKTSGTRSGITIGTEVDIPRGESFAFVTGLQYSTKGGELAGSENKLGLLEIPAVARFSLAGGKVYATTGINLGFLMSTEYGDGTSFDEDLGSINLELVLGGGVVLAYGKFRAGVQYELGLINLSDIANMEYKSRNLQIVVGFAF